MDEPVKDLGISHFALSMARFLDRLPAGEFELRLFKPADKRLPYVAISRIEHIKNIFATPAGVGETGETA